MTPILDRRAWLTGLAALAGAHASMARAAGDASVTDGAGRTVAIPARVERVFPAGPPAAILLYTLAPDLLLGWPRANSPEERVFLLPEIGARPEVGRLTGRGGTANLEAVLTLKPDLILDVGSTAETYRSLAERVQGQTGIPYALLDGKLERTAASYRLLGRLLGRERDAEALAAYCDGLLARVLERVAGLADARKPRVYYARGKGGLETARPGSINVESVELAGGRNVVTGERGGLAAVSLEQVLGWDPEVIVTVDAAVARTVRTDPSWAPVSAVRAGRVHLAPTLPFGWIDSPPSVNRMVGLAWLAHILHPDLFPDDPKPIARDFYTRFYHVTPSEPDLDRAMGG